MTMAAKWIVSAGALALAAIWSVEAAPLSYALPDETATLADGPHLEVVQANCVACHSSDYISTQPRGLANPRAFWTTEVAKMQKAYGAPVSDEDVHKIMEYLVQTYGK